MASLTEQLSARIAQHGPMPFREFMEAALYHPQHGYYSSGRAALGREGDYFTNVSVGPLFGTLMMRQFAEMWRRLGEPERFSVVEQGAHHGLFACDVLASAHSLEPTFAAALQYIIVEPLPVQRISQRVNLAQCAQQVTWVSDLQDLPPFVGVHFSNELIDAFPVHVVGKSSEGAEWHEWAVGWEEGRFVWKEVPFSNLALADAVARLPRQPPAPYCTEVNLAAGQWVREVAEKLERGWVLAIDYGYPHAEYYRPERSEGTLSAYAQHQRVKDPLQSPGDADLTAHVDFSSLTEDAEAAGLRLCGFADQHHLMVGLSGLHFGDTENITPEHQKEMRAFKTLMHPNLMGAAFKAICFARVPEANSAPLAGFRYAGEGRDRL